MVIYINDNQATFSFDFFFDASIFFWSSGVICSQESSMSSGIKSSEKALECIGFTSKTGSERTITTYRIL